MILVGLPGSGKTAAGALAAEELGAPFVDLDPLIELRAGRSISRIFQEDGEAAFRAWESSLGAEVLDGPPAVVSPGGGFVLDDEMRRLARAKGLLVYLKTSPEVAASRVGHATGRPLLQAGEPLDVLRDLLHSREAAYLEAEEVVTTDSRTPEEVAHAVSELARRRGGW